MFCLGFCLDFYRDHLTPRSQLHPRNQVSFEESSTEPAKNLNVQSFEIQPAKELLGDPVNPGETWENHDTRGLGFMYLVYIYIFDFI